jgi:2-dehydro-3-deoxyphosphogluconate aldolase/(4S)-4-hydroxy-2-oxoglutarate aldolase
MKTENEITNLIKNIRVLPLFYDDDMEVCKAIVSQLYSSGIKCIEFTNRGKNAFANFQELLKLRDAQMPDLLLAIGTIKNEKEASEFIKIGADFLISPFFDQSIADICYLHKKLWIPGCMTPTEIHLAEQSGCSLIKIFPGNTLGPDFIKAVKPLFPDVNFIVTGGVDITDNNLQSWFNAGVSCVGIGSKLISKSILLNKDLDGLDLDTKKLLNILSLIPK